MYELVTHANDSPQRDQPLSKLKTLKPSWPAGFYNGQDLSEVEPFLALKSLREVYIGSGYLFPDHIGQNAAPFGTRYGPLGVNVSLLEMNQFSMDGKALKLLLSSMTNLRTLRLRYGELDDDRPPWRVDTVASILNDGVGKTLETLSITVGTLTYGDLDPWRSNLKGCSHLKDLELDTRLFYNYYRLERLTPQQQRQIQGVPRLLDIVPTSVQNIHLITHKTTINAACLESLLVDFPWLKQEPLLNLQEVSVLRGDRDPWLEQCEDQIYTESKLVEELRGNGVIDLRYTEACAEPEFSRTWNQRWGV